MSKYAIIETGAKQYRVEPETVIEVEKLAVPENETQIAIDRVLLVCEEEKTWIGSPYVKGAKVVCDYLGDLRGPKVISFKYRRRKASRRKKGHRQSFTRLRVKEIQVAGS